MAQIKWPIIMCDSCIMEVLDEGTFIEISHSLSSLFWSLPVSPTMIKPLFFASSTDLIIFVEFPDVEIAM